MQILENAPQGSAAWHAARAGCFCASEASAAMGVSKYTTRTELLHQKKTGVAPEVSPAKQRLFDAGHQSEAAALSIAEDLAGVEFYPAVGICDFDGLPLLASFDGIDMLEEVLWENKLLNNSLIDQIGRSELDPHYWAQLEHQLLVSGASKALFTTSDGTQDGTHYIWYTSDPDRRERVVKAWKQFAVDLAAYVPSTAPAAPAVVAGPMESLPAVSVIVSGEITIKDNFKAFEVALTDFLEHRLIREPKSDQDFADLDTQIKAMKGAEAALDNAEAGWIAQIDAVGAAKRSKDMLHKLVRENRLMAEKLLTSEKDRRKLEIKTAGDTALQAHFDALNARLTKPYMPASYAKADFGGAIKGLRSLASMEDAVNTLLANAKIAANEAADKIQTNLDALRELAKDHAFLFADTPTLVLKANDDLRAVIANRIGEHEKAEAERLAAERERIAAEERRKAEAAAAETIRKAEEAAAAKAREEERQCIEEEKAVARLATPVPAVAPTPSPAPAPTSTVVAMKPRAAAPVAAPAERNSIPTLRIGAINDRFGDWKLSEEGLRGLGIEPAGRDRANPLYHEADFPRICRAISARAERLADEHENHAAKA